MHRTLGLTLLLTLGLLVGATPARESGAAPLRAQAPTVWNGDIYVVNADGSGERRITRGEPPGEWDPRWSPDGRHIVFAEIDGIVVVNADGQDRQRITVGPADDDNPDWSPVGSRIAFDASRDVWDEEIYVVDPNGTRMTNLTDSPPLDSNPSWSRDGRRIAFMRKRNRHVQARLFVMDADEAPRRTSA